MKTIRLGGDKERKIFFTSDWHIGHKNVLNFMRRPFNNIKEMRDALVSNFNEIVTNEDIVFVLGDFLWFPSRTETLKIVKKLNGSHIYFIFGNHDSEDMYDFAVENDPDRITVLGDIARVLIEDNGHLYSDKKEIELFLSHYPLMTWPHRDKGSLNLFGHIHTSRIECPEQSDFDMSLPFHDGLQYDCGVDWNHFKPIELKDVLSNIKEFTNRSQK